MAKGKRVLQAGSREVLRHYNEIVINATAIGPATEDILDTWMFTEVSTREMSIQLVFKKPLTVSMSNQNEQDKLSLHFADRFFEECTDLTNGDYLDLTKNRNK